MELQVYSSVAGELVNLVHTKTPQTFVPYRQALTLQQQINSLRQQIADLEGRLTVRCEPPVVNIEIK